MSTSSTSSTKSTSSQKKDQIQQQNKVTSTASSQSTSSSLTKNEIIGVPRRTSINKSRSESPQQSDSERSITNSAPGSMWVAVNNNNNKSKPEKVASKQNPKRIASPKLNDPTKRPAGGEGSNQRNKIAKSGKDSAPTSNASQIRTSEVAGSSSNPKGAKSQPKRRISRPKKKPFSETCPNCFKHFNRPDYLENHRIASENYFCKVPDCPGKYKVRCFYESLRQHHNLEHKDIPFEFEGMFACDWPGCDKTFTREAALAPHKLTHTSEAYKCDVCEHIFRGKHEYETHMKMRDFYICEEDDCKNKTLEERKFCTKHRLKQHIEKGHKKKFVRTPGPFQCDQPKCDKSFSQKTRLTSHLRECHSIETKE